MRRPSDLQTQYQKNYLISLGVTATLAGVFSGYIIMLGNSSSNTKVIPSKAHNIKILDRENIEVSDRAAKRTLVNWRKTNQSGFQGFGVHIKVIPDSRPQSISVNHPVVSIDPGEPEIIDEPISFSAFEGEEQGIFIGDNVEFSYGYDPSQKLDDRGIMVVSKRDPEYPFVARDEGKEGVASVLVFIDKNGKCIPFDLEGVGEVSYHVIREKPTGWYFAQNLVKTLPYLVCSPKIEQGQPVADFLVITYHFCLGINCARYEIVER